MYLAIFTVASFSLGLLLVASGNLFLVGQKAQVYDVYGTTFPMALLIVISIGITVGALVSDTSFYKRSSSVGSCQVLVFILLVVLILSLELSAISAGLIMSDSVLARAGEEFRRQMATYGAANASSAPADHREPWIDATQRSFRCCGLVNATDWAAHRAGVPASCCRGHTGDGQCGRNSSQLHPLGCASVIGAWMRGEVRIFASLVLALFLLQLTGLGAAFYRRYLSWRPKIPPEEVTLPESEKR